MPTRPDVDAWGWHQYGDGYWQRDDGRVNIVEEEDGVFAVTLSHRFGARYASEQLGFVLSLEEAVLLGQQEPIIEDRAAHQRANLEAAPDGTSL